MIEVSVISSYDTIVLVVEAARIFLYIKKRFMNRNEATMEWKKMYTDALREADEAEEAATDRTSNNARWFVI